MQEKGKETEIKTIDGSVLEGGGQILRNAVAYSALLSRPIRITSIRQNRENPGLKPQHLAGIRLIAEISSADLSNAVLSSSAITFLPREIRGGVFVADTKTAGSITLLLQCALPCLFFSPKEVCVRFIGGTNVEMAPQIEFTIMILQHILLNTCKCRFSINIERYGFYPKGLGVVTISDLEILDTIEQKLASIVLIDPGNLVRISGVCWGAGNAISNKELQEMNDEAKETLKAVFPDIPWEVKVERRPKNSFTGKGCAGLVIFGETSTGCRLSGTSVVGQGGSARRTGESAAKALIQSLQNYGCIDEYLQDQLIIFMALAKGRSSILTGPISLHTETAIYIAEQMTDARFLIEKLRYRIVNVFCPPGPNKLQGNALAVFEDGALLSSEQMQAIACQFNLSETSFILPETSSDATKRVRIFTPGLEMPFAGHPTIGTSFVVNRLVGRCTALEMKAGVVQTFRADEESWGFKISTAAAYRAPPNLEELAVLINLPTDVFSIPASATPFIPASFVNAGVEQLVVQVRDVDSLNAATCAFADMKQFGVEGALLFVLDPESTGNNFKIRSRFFFRDKFAVFEDPGTGSACANLGCLLLREQRPGSYILHQGHALGRLCEIKVVVQRSDNISFVAISGRVVEVGSGTLLL